MEAKIKIVIIIAAALLAISIFVNLQIYGSKKAIQLELETVKNENTSLNKKLEESRKEAKNVQEKMNTLNKELNKVSQEKEDLRLRKDDLQKQYDALLKEREKLVEKLGSTEPAFKEAPKEAEPVVSDSYWAGILKQKTYLELKFKALQASYEQLQREKNTLEMNLSSLAREKKDLEEQLQYNQKMLDDIASEFVKENNARFQTQDKLSSLRSDNAVLKRQLNILNNTNAKLEKKIGELTEERATLERRLIDMELYLNEKVSNVGDVRRQLDQLRSGSATETREPKEEFVELPPIVVRPKAEIAVPEEGAGVSRRVASILTINRENNFIIVDLGEEEGVRIGDTFNVYRKDTLIATVEVIQVRGRISACDITKETTPIKPGDKVR